MDFRHLSRGIAAADRMRLRGMTPNGHLLWERLEADNLRFGHPDYRSVIALNVRRTLPAHYSKAGRLGISKSREWQDNDLIKLRRHFAHGSAEALQAMFPERSWLAICSRARKMGLRRQPQPPRPSGNKLLDQVRLRAKQWGVTMRELDRETGGRGYFALTKWRHGTFNVSLHARAVSVLGGHLQFRSEVALK